MNHQKKKKTTRKMEKLKKDIERLKGRERVAEKERKKTYAEEERRTDRNFNTKGETREIR